MPDLTYDLHIHSCLSPCGDDEMTPANLTGMAALKGLDVIALTDHNTARNCPAAAAFAEQYGLLFIPGMEINTAEEVHAVCLFPTVEKALDFDAYVYSKLQKVKNKPEFFGNQILYNEKDEITGYEPNLLINATDVPFDGLYELVRSYGGVMFPAHIEKGSNSLIANLGFVPPDSKFRTAELKDLKKLHELRKSNPYLNDCRIISDSDAHQLDLIREPGLTIPVKEKSVEGVLAYLAGE